MEKYRGNSETAKLNANRAVRVKEAAQANFDQIEAFFDEHKEYWREDRERSLKTCKHLTRAANSAYEVWKSRLDVEVSVKQMRMTELNITESRSAIGCKFNPSYSSWTSKGFTKRIFLVTVLASVFVPISLASSIFGMNIQEINQSGHSIWTFVVCAFSMLALTSIACLTWQARRNYKVLQHRACDEANFVLPTWQKKKVLEKVLSTWRQFHSDIEYPKQRALYRAGFRRAEKVELPIRRPREEF